MNLKAKSITCSCVLHSGSGSAHAPHVFQIHWYMTQIFPFLFVSLLRNAEHRVKNQQEQGIFSKSENNDIGR